MSSIAMQTGIHRLRGLLAAPRAQESDEQLLHAFLANRDDNVFATLVRRHGSMVLHVCRRVLGHHQDAEDAFQATFLLLARNAGCLRNKSALASWLHGTAYRTAMKARQSAARRRKHEGRTPPRLLTEPSRELLWREVQTLLDEEIARLPEVYRSVFVLCCLESLSRAEAGRRLGLKERTVTNRLAEARRRLQLRLARRGVELTAVLAAAALTTSAASALPAALVGQTMGLACGSGRVSAETIAPRVAALAESGLHAGKAKVAAAVVLVAGVLAGAGLWSYRGLTVQAAAVPADPPAAAASEKPKAPPAEKQAAKTKEIQGRVFGPDGEPKAGAEIFLLGEHGKSQKLGVSADEGKFTIALPNEAKGGHLLARCDGAGLDFLDLGSVKPDKLVEFRLVKDLAIRGRVVTTEGKPARGVRVAVNMLGVYANNSMDSFLVAWKKRHFMSGLPGGVKHIWQQLGADFAATTDADGRFMLAGLGADRLVSLSLRGGGIADAELWIVNRDGFDPKPYNQATVDNIPRGMDHLSVRWLLHGPDFSFAAEAEKPISGIVKDVETGKGRPGVTVRLTREGANLLRVMPEARTDAEGRYTIRGARKLKSYMFEVSADTKAGYMPSQVHVADTPGYQPITADIPVKKGVVITGKMLDKTTGKPVPGHVMVAVLQHNPFAKNYPSFDGSAWFPMQQTGADGSFRLVGIPGPVLLMGGPNDFKTRAQYLAPAADPKYPEYFTKDPQFVAYYGLGGGMSPIQGSHGKVLIIKADAKAVEQDIVLERAPVLPVHIQDADGQPLPGTWVTGSSPEDWHPAIRSKEADCAAYQLQPGKPRLMVFFHPGRKLAGAITIKGDEKAPVVAKLGPAGTIKGRLLDADGAPLAGVAIDVGYGPREAREIHNILFESRQIVTDAAGTFTCDDLIPGVKFNLSFHQGKRRYQPAEKSAPKNIEVTPGPTRDVGALKLQQIPEKVGD
jgi:RNA polymerase sigma factor (sigma-70 family)